LQTQVLYLLRPQPGWQNSGSAYRGSNPWGAASIHASFNQSTVWSYFCVRPVSDPGGLPGLAQEYRPTRAPTKRVGRRLSRAGLRQARFARNDSNEIARLPSVRMLPSEEKCLPGCAQAQQHRTPRTGDSASRSEAIVWLNCSTIQRAFGYR